MRRSLFLAAAAVLMSTPCLAAELVVAEGNVLVNRGNGFFRANAGQQLLPGDKVMLGTQGGTARIAHSDSCFETVTPGHLVVVTSNPCPPGSGTDGAGGGGLGGLSSVNPVVLSAVGTAAVIGGVAAVSAGKKDKKGSSP